MQGRDDNGDAITMQSRDLETEGLASTGRHQDKSILTGDQGFDNLALLGPEFTVAEDLMQGLARTYLR